MAEDMAEGKKRVILAIDDNVQQLNEFKSMLVPQFDLRVVKSASEAINLLNKASIELIILDIEMPNVDGFEFFNDVKRIPSYFVTPIIIVSGNSGEEFTEKAKKVGAFDVLTKPVNPEQLIQIIEKAFASINKA